MKALSTTLVFLFLSSSTHALPTSYDHGSQGSPVGGPHAITSITNDSTSSTLAYDANGDLLNVVEDGVTQNEFHYQVNRKLRQSTENQSSVTDFFYTSTGEKIATQNSVLKTDIFVEPYLRFTNEIPRLSYGRDAETDETGSEVKFSIRDHLGSVVASVSHSAILERQDTLPYGEAWFRDHIGVVEERGFNGNSKEGGLIDYNARHYFPELGTFVQADPTIPKIDAQGFNRYMYVSANPVNRIDPTGFGDRQSVAQAYNFSDLSWHRAGVFLFGVGVHPQPIQSVYLSAGASGGLGPGVRTMVEVEAGGGIMFMPELGDGSGGWGPMGFLQAGGGQDYSPMIPLVGVTNTTDAAMIFAPGGPFTSFTNTSTVSLDVPVPVGWATGREEFVVDLETGETFFVTGAGWGAVGDAVLVSGSAQIFLNVQTEKKLMYVEPENNWFVRTYMLAIEGVESMIRGAQNRQEWMLNQEDLSYPANIDENGVWVSEAGWDQN